MKKYIFLLLLIPFLLGADETKTVNGVSDASIKNVIGITGSTVKNCMGKDYNDGDAVAAYCAACPDAAGGADIACESFEGTSQCEVDEAEVCMCLAGWTVDETTGAVVFNTAHSGTLSCTDKGSYAVQVTKAADSGLANASLAWTDTNNIYVQFYINVVTLPLNDGARTTNIAGINGDGSNVILVKLKTLSAGATYIYFGYYNGTGFTYTADETNAVTANTWYRIRLGYKKDTGATDGVVQIYLGDTEIVNISNNASTRDTDMFYVGLKGADTDAYVVQMDNLKIDDDTMPTACGS